MTAREVAIEFWKGSTGSTDEYFPASGRIGAELDLIAQRTIDRIRADIQAKPPDAYSSLCKFRQLLREQLYDSAESQDFCKVAKIAAAINVMGDLLNMPAVKAWELPF
jgi:hypothetical protein